MADLSGNSGAAIEIRQIRAAAHGDVLAIIHVAAVGQHVRRGAPAKIWPLLQQPHAQP